jgi:hypothetical protein
MSEASRLTDFVEISIHHLRPEIEARAFEKPAETLRLP